MSDRETRLRERRARIDHDDPDAQLAALVAAARGGDPVAQLHMAMRRWLSAARPAPTDPEVQARCSDPAWGLAYDDERFGRMVYVPDHVALLGSREDDRAAYADETPQMAVAVPAYWIAQEPMTIDRWRALGRTEGSASPHGYVVSVSWDDVTAALGQVAEEGDDADRVLRSGCWYYNDASYSRAANRFRDSPGLGSGSLGFRPARSVDGGAEAGRVHRGGGWDNGAHYMRSAYRSVYSTGSRDGDLGFRPARSAETDGDAYRTYRGGSWIGTTARLRYGIEPGYHDACLGFRPAAGARLPTEDEWEAAARGPLGSVYPWGDEWRPRVEDRIGPGGASWCGVQGMSGSVWQWTADAWSERRHPTQEAET